MRIAAAQPHLLVFAALHGAGAEAVMFMHLDVILFRKATVPLRHANIARFRIVLDIFHR